VVQTMASRLLLVLSPLLAVSALETRAPHVILAEPYDPRNFTEDPWLPGAILFFLLPFKCYFEPHNSHCSFLCM
jgi:hypothetical protein